MSGVEDVVSLAAEFGKAKELVLIAIDGHSAAGKSTLARTLQRVLENVQIVFGDDFYRVMTEAERFHLGAIEGHQRYYDWERLENQVLRPLSVQQPARFQVYDWEASTLERWKVVQPLGIVLVEGVFSARPELRHYYDAILFVETPKSIRDERQRQRGDATSLWFYRWEAAEKHYLETYGLDDHADLIVSVA